MLNRAMPAEAFKWFTENHVGRILTWAALAGGIGLSAGYDEGLEAGYDNGIHSALASIAENCMTARGITPEVQIGMVTHGSMAEFRRAESECAQEAMDRLTSDYAVGAQEWRTIYLPAWHADDPANNTGK